MQDSKRKIRELVKVAVFFILLLFLGLKVSNMLIDISSKNDSVIASRNKNLIQVQKENKDSLDAIIVGDSESYSSFSPLQMWSDHGFTSYVCGQPGQKIQETYYMLKTVLENQSPKVVVLETNTLFRAQTGIEGVTEEVAEKSSYYFPVFRYHDIWKPLLFKKNYRSKTFKGYVMRSTVGSYDGGNYMIPSKDRIAITGGVKDNMDQIKTLCEEHGAILCLISVPSPANYNYQKHNELFAYASEENIPYLDLNLELDTLGIDWKKDSEDKGDHLNLSGAQKVTNYVGSYLKENYDLPDHREDSSYESWNKEAEKYQSKAEDVIALIQMK